MKHCKLDVEMGEEPGACSIFYIQAGTRFFANDSKNEKATST